MRSPTAAMLICLLAAPAGAQQVIRAKDGDVILVENDDKVKVVRRRHANVRVVHHGAQRWVLLLVDYLPATDGLVDMTYSFRDISGDWPLGERWEGTAFVDHYDMAGEAGTRGLGLTTSSGLIQFINPTLDRRFADPAAIATLIYKGSGSGTARVSFDAAEQREVARLAPGGGPPEPVRVGGSLKSPTKIKHVDPVLPDAARQAGVFGMVILELVIASDGTVQQARVLRSIPLLDEAAVQAAKQWVFEPTLLNGVPVPVTITATVPFR